MGSVVVKQPNGLLSIYSTTSDMFEFMNMSPEDTFEVLLRAYEMGRKDAADKVVRGIEDHEPHRHMVKGNGLSRWKNSLKSCLKKNRAEYKRQGNLPVEEVEPYEPMTLRQRLRAALEKGLTPKAFLKEVEQALYVTDGNVCTDPFPLEHAETVLKALREKFPDIEFESAADNPYFKDEIEPGTTEIFAKKFMGTARKWEAFFEVNDVLRGLKK